MGFYRYFAGALIFLFASIAYGQGVASLSTGPYASGTLSVTVGSPSQNSGFLDFPVTWSLTGSSDGVDGARSITFSQTTAGGSLSNSTGTWGVPMTFAAAETGPKTVSGAAILRTPTTGFPRNMVLTIGSYAGTTTNATIVLTGNLLDPQNVTVTPSSGYIEYTQTGGGASGQNTFQGTAAGAQGGNEYRIEVISGPVTSAILPGTGNWVLTATGLGPFQAKVWALAGNGYAKSNDAIISGSVVDDLKHKVTVNFDNRGSDLSTTFKVYQDGAVVHTESLPAGGVQIRTIEVPSSSPVTVVSVTSGIGETGGVFYVDQGAITEKTEGQFTPVEVAGTATPPPAGTVSPTGAPNTQQPQPATDKQVFQNVNAANAQTGLTNAMFAEGVDKIIGELKNQSDDQDESIEEQIEKGMAKLDEETDGFDVQGFVDNLAASAQAALDAIAGVASEDFESAVPGIGASSGISSATGNPASSWSLGVIDSGLPNGRWELRPFERFPWLRGMLLVIREVFLWGMCYIFYANVQAAVMKLQAQLNQVEQLDTVADGAISVMGNRIPGLPSVVALAKRLFVGVSIITAINLTFVALIGVMNSRINEVFGGKWTLSNIGNVMQALAGKNEYFDHVAQLVSLTFPINAAIQLMVGWLVFCFAAMTVFQAAASVIKATKI